MFLYNMTLQRPTCIMNAVAGNFSGTKQQEILVGRGNVLELNRLDTTTGKVLSVQVFGVIRSLTPVRLTGSSKDYIVVGSDSGRINILEYDPQRNIFEKVHEETFGKSGCRRIVPGQFLATDPKGRAVMIASVEKQKLVYILNRDQKARLTISSPLEAHKSHAILFHVVGLDVGFENPVFACLELDYSEADEDPTQEALAETRQNLVFYQLDLGLNHVVRQASEPLEDIANMLVTVPGGNDGPGGVLVCVENFVLYKNMGEQKEIRVPIPRREGEAMSERAIIIVSAATVRSKQILFFLLQSEQGDLFKLSLVIDDEEVKDMQIQYFDTIPVANGLVMLKAGFLFSASEFGNHFLYQISHLGQDSDQIFSSDSMEGDEPPSFRPRELTNLLQFSEMESLCPILDCKIAHLGEEQDVPQFYMVCGRGPSSSFKTLRHGLEVTEMAVSELPGNPNNIWTVKKRLHDEYDSYIIVSFVNATLVLSIGENVEEVVDSGFLATSPTLNASTLGDDALLQVYPEGIRHIRADKRVNEWKAPAKSTIGHSAVNNRQVAITLHGTELVYFELDAAGQLNEYAERLNTDSEIRCIAMGSVPPGRQRSRFLAVGLAVSLDLIGCGLQSNVVVIYSLDPEDCLQQLAIQAVPFEPSSLCLADMDEGSEGGEQTTQFLTIGLANGVMLRTVVDPVSGNLSDTRTRYLGSRPVKMHRIKVQHKDAVMALSSRSWLQYPYQGRLLLTPLSYEPLDVASGFASAQCPEGVVAIAGNTLRIISTEKLGVSFNQSSVRLGYTPRHLAIHPDSNMMVVIETDHAVQPAKDKGNGDSMEEDDGLPEHIFGPKRAEAGTWGSQVRLIDPSTFHTSGHNYILVGTAKDLELRPRKCDGGFIYTFKLVDNAQRLELVHKTPVTDVPGAMCAFQGRVLVSVGRLLRIYDMGKKKLLLKCENKSLPHHIVSIMAMGVRVYVGDIQESWHFMKYKADRNQLVVFADDVSPRWTTTGCMLDYNTIAGADKFGNVHVLRLPDTATDDVDEDPSGAKVTSSRGYLGGASQKLDYLNEFHVGETIMSMQRVTLVPGGSEGIVYTTINGSIGMLCPFGSKEDVTFFQTLEMHMQQHAPPLCGRDHLQYRSYYFPRKNVVDGDLAEQYNILPMAKKREIAADLDRTPAEVAKKLEDMRSRYAF